MPAIPVDLLEKGWHDLVMHSGLDTQHLLSRHEIVAEVERLAATPADWVSRVRLDPEGRWYEQIHLSDTHEVWLISWLPGQLTGFHDHGASSGAFTVVWGALSERMVSGSAIRTHSVEQGTIRAFGPKYVHDVANVSADSVAVSLHCYSPPLSEMTRYELTEGGNLKVTGTEGTANW
jgi:predicted metal-dependent enzyme (double-stranded beta helix superfamily)